MAGGHRYRADSYKVLVRTISWRSRLTTLVANNCGTLKNPHTIRKRVGHGFPGVMVWPLPKSKTSGLAAVLRDHS